MKSMMSTKNNGAVDLEVPSKSYPGDLRVGETKIPKKPVPARGIPRLEPVATLTDKEHS